MESTPGVHFFCTFALEWTSGGNLWTHWELTDHTEDADALD